MFLQLHFIIEKFFYKHLPHGHSVKCSCGQKKKLPYSSIFFFLILAKPEENNLEATGSNQSIPEEETNTLPFPLTPLSRTAARILSCITSPFLDTNRKRTFSENSSSNETEVKRFKTNSSSSAKSDNRLMIRFPFSSGGTKRKTNKDRTSSCSSDTFCNGGRADDHTKPPNEVGKEEEKQQKPPTLKRSKHSTLTEYYANGETRPNSSKEISNNSNKITTPCQRSNRKTYDKAIRNNYKISDWFQRTETKKAPVSPVPVSSGSTLRTSDGIPPIRSGVDVENNTTTNVVSPDNRKSPISPLLNSLSSVLRESNNLTTFATELDGTGGVTHKLSSLQEQEAEKVSNTENMRTPPRPPGIPRFVSPFPGHCNSPELSFV
jgi:hypothetical protein